MAAMGFIWYAMQGVIIISLHHYLAVINVKSFGIMSFNMICFCIKIPMREA